MRSHPPPSPGRPEQTAATAPGSLPQVFWVLVIATAVSLQLELPFRLAGLPLCVGAIVAGIALLLRLQTHRRFERFAAPGSSTAAQQRPRRSWPIAAGIGLCGVLMLNFMVDAALYPVVAEREQCLAGANTEVAKQQCADQALQRLEDLRQRLSRPR